MNTQFEFFNTISIIKYCDGSLPNGRKTTNVPIWRIDFNDFFINSNLNDKKTIKKDINLNGVNAFLVDNILSENHCNHFIEIFEKIGFRPEAPSITTPPGMRMNKTLHFIASDNIMVYLFERIKEHLPIILDNKKLFNKLSYRINVYKYEKGDFFDKHIDGDWPGYGIDANNNMIEFENCKSKLSMLLYLNDDKNGIIGGATTLYNNNHEEINIQPKQGSALFFCHGFSENSVLHKGCELLSIVPKYVARINILYEE